MRTVRSVTLRTQSSRQGRRPRLFRGLSSLQKVGQKTHRAKRFLPSSIHTHLRPKRYCTMDSFVFQLIFVLFVPSSLLQNHCPKFLVPCSEFEATSSKFLFPSSLFRVSCSEFRFSFTEFLIPSSLFQVPYYKFLYASPLFRVPSSLFQEFCSKFLALKTKLQRSILIFKKPPFHFFKVGAKAGSHSF